MEFAEFVMGVCEFFFSVLESYVGEVGVDYLYGCAALRGVAGLLFPCAVVVPDLLVHDAAEAVGPTFAGGAVVTGVGVEEGELLVVEL